MEVEKKQFIVPRVLSEGVDGIAEKLGGKGNLKRVGAAAILMFLHASEEERAAYLLWSDGIALDAASVDRPPLISRLAQLRRLPGHPEEVQQFAIALRPWLEDPLGPAEPARLVDEGQVSLGEVPRSACVPVLDPVRGGKPIAPRDGDHSAGFSGTFVVFQAADPRACAIMVEGRMMAPYFKHGDLVIVSPGREKNFRSGMLGAVVFRGERPYEFRMVTRKRGGKVILECLQEDFGSETIDASDIEAVYPGVLGVRR